MSTFLYLICRILKRDNEKVKKFLPICLGLLSCLYGCSRAVSGLYLNQCKLYLNLKSESTCWTVDCLVQGFRCSKCDRKLIFNPDEQHPTIICQSDMHGEYANLDGIFIQLQSLFFELLFDGSSEDIQVSCVGVIHRILAHGSPDILLKTRSEWIKSVEFLLLRKSKDLREAFCCQISSFVEDHILSLIFPGDTDKSKEERLLDMIKHAMEAAESPQILETLMECTAEIMVAVGIDNPLFLGSLILMIDQLDSSHVTVRMNASRLIHKSCYLHFKGRLELILSKDVHIRTELFNYLSERLAIRPLLVREFAEAVFGVETEQLVKKMIPFVLPKLVVSQQDNSQAVCTLYELAKCLNTDMVPLIVNWLPKVLAFALHQEDDQQLLAAVQFYHAQTGSDKQEIFAAALPALLDELVCFVDGGDSDEISRR